MKFIKFPLTFLLFAFPLFQFTSIFSTQFSNKQAKQITLTSKETVQNYSQSKPILEIDSNSANTVEELGGGIYYQEVDAIVPFFPSLVRAEWMQLKNEIIERIGYISPVASKESSLWKNSATSVNSLIKDAHIAAPDFWKMCVYIANKTGTVANFGIRNQYMIKSKKSISRKVKESIEKGLSEEEAVGKVRDSLRGTIIAETPEQITLIVQALKEFAYREARQIVFINIWEDNRPSGYVGIHAKMLFPIYDRQGKNTQKNIIIEVQIHLTCIMDGTLRCVKEREHLLYEQMRKGGADPEIQTAASTLLYLTALKQCPKKAVRKDTLFNNLHSLK